jgi:hypothetical protein
MTWPPNVDSSEKRTVFAIMVATMLALVVVPLGSRAAAVREEVRIKLSQMTPEEREYAQGSWWRKSEEEKALQQVSSGAICSISIIPIIAYFLTPRALSAVEWFRDRHERHRTLRQQKLLELKYMKMERTNEQLETKLKLAQSKQELVAKLGAIDQFIRVLEHESDASKRTLCLQSMQAELTTISARLLGGDIHPSAVDDPHVRQSAEETIEELRRAGLGTDRISRDVVRLFKL